LRDWLAAHAVTHMAMESTGVYWKCVYYVLEDDFEALLVNARHIKHVPGRKTDTIDAAWIAQLLACGLLKGSLVPPRPIRELRDLTRYRKALIYERSRAINRLHKVLEDAGWTSTRSAATDAVSVITNSTIASGSRSIDARSSSRRTTATFPARSRNPARPRDDPLNAYYELAWDAVTIEDFGRFLGWLRSGDSLAVASVERRPARFSESTVALRLQAVCSFYRFQH